MDLNENDVDAMKNYEQRLDQEWVQVLINLRMKYSHLFTRKRNSAADAWKNILQEMKELGAPPFVSLNKIKKKWMNLIARYKYLKFSTNSQTITWPFFEQLDRAYSRNPNIVELRKSDSKKGSDSDDTTITDYTTYMLKKQKFTSTLIQLRHAYRHLFTGKKFAAQKGWFVIQNLLPNGDNYTIEQISKCWQNLMQRYKNLIETEPDHSKITWVHFKTMHETMLKRSEPEAEPEAEQEPPVKIKTEIQSPRKNEYDETEQPKKNVIRLILTNPPLKQEKNIKREGEFNDGSNKVRIIEESENDKKILLVEGLDKHDKKILILKSNGENNLSKNQMKTENTNEQELQETKGANEGLYENPIRRICLERLKEDENKRLCINPLNRTVLQRENINDGPANEDKEMRNDMEKDVTIKNVLAHLIKSDEKRDEFHSEVKASLEQIIRLLKK